MIGHGREVERTVDGRRPGRALLLVDDRDRGTAREVVGVPRADPGAEDVGVGREARVDVEVAEEGLPERRRLRAGRAGLGPHPRRRGGRRDRGESDDEEDDDASAHGGAVS